MADDKLTPSPGRLGTFRPWPENQIYSEDAYVASEEFLDSLVRTIITASIERRTSKLRRDRAMRKDITDCRRAARILLGRDKRYQTIPFYAPGGIDEHLAKWCGVDERTPTKRVVGALVAMLVEIHEIANEIGDRLEEHWDFQIDGIIQFYVGLLMGFTPGQIAAA